MVKEQATPAQIAILEALSEGCALSSLFSGRVGFGVDLSDHYQTISITTVKSMLHKGLIAEARRYSVSDGLEHITYSMTDEGYQAVLLAQMERRRHYPLGTEKEVTCCTCKKQCLCTYHATGLVHVRPFDWFCVECWSVAQETN